MYRRYLLPSSVITVQPSSRIFIVGDPSQRTGSEILKINMAKMPYFDYAFQDLY